MKPVPEVYFRSHNVMSLDAGTGAAISIEMFPVFDSQKPILGTNLIYYSPCYYIGGKITVLYHGVK